MKKISFTPEQEAEINHIQKTTGVTRKSAIRKTRAAAKVQAKAAKSSPKPQARKNSPSISRAAGIALYKLAGRPKKEDFLHVYGAMGAKWTWEQRAKAVGVPTAELAATQFRAMLKKSAESCMVAK